MQRKLVVSIFLLSLSVLSFGQEFRSIDGTGNDSLDRGSKGAPLRQRTEIAFSDSISEPAGILRENPRVISNVLFAQDDENITDEGNRSDYLWVFGQFLDHDLSLVDQDQNDLLTIMIPTDDAWFSPTGPPMPMLRSLPMEGSGTDINNPRQYRNQVTSFLDGSAVYGSDQARSDFLRANDGSGKLRTSQGNLPPWNTIDGEYNSNCLSPMPEFAEMDDEGDNIRLFVTGDVRANENPLLLSMHTIFIREHNRICDELVEKNPEWDGDDDKLFFTARKYLTAYLQGIVYYEWLPSQGVYLSNYSGYQAMDPSIFNVFSAAAFRMGHTLINSELIRMSNSGGEIPSGNISLRDAFFNPLAINLAGGIEPYLKGMATQTQQGMDCKVIDDVRNFLFGTPDDGGIDLAAININRGRERGLANYNSIRNSFGKPQVQTFFGLTGDQESADLLESIYDDIDDVDPWVGMLAERHLPNDALFGDLIMVIMEEQFQLLRDGDRYYFENDDFTTEEIEIFKNTTLHDVIMRNTDIEIMQTNVFQAMQHTEIPNGPDLTNLQLEAVAYPNPTFGEIHIKLYAELENTLHLSLFDPYGRMVSTDEWDVIRGDNFMTMNIGDKYPRGIYNLMIESSNSFNILKIVKEK